jgi:hypothetical protein
MEETIVLLVVAAAVLPAVLLAWDRSEGACSWCAYEREMHARGRSVRVLGRLHTCWRGRP